MQRHTLTLAFSLAGALMTLGSVAHAQTTPTAVRPVVPTASTTLPDLKKTITPFAAEQMPLKEVIAKLSAQTGATIIVDSASGAKPVTLDLRNATLGDVLDQIADQAGKGVQVRLVALPIQDPLPNGDVVALALMAQDSLKPLQLTGIKPGEKIKPPAKATTPTASVVASATATEPTIEVSGRAVTLDKAAPLISALELRPVFVVMNPLGDNPVAKAGRLQSEGMQLWMGMTAEQRKQATESQLNNLLSMDPSTRRAFFGQMMEQAQGAMQKIQSLPPDQQKQFFQDITANLPKGATPGKPNGGGN